MANEVVKTGKVYRILADEANKIWHKLSIWSKASDTEFNDGKDAETKLGAIDGITDSLSATSSRIAASAKAVNTLSNNAGRIRTYVGSDGKLHFVNSAGADTVLNFSGNGGAKLLFSDYTSTSWTTGNVKTINLSGYRKVLIATTYWRNEPFDSCSRYNVIDVGSEKNIKTSSSDFAQHINQTIKVDTTGITLIKTSNSARALLSEVYGFLT